MLDYRTGCLADHLGLQRVVEELTPRYFVSVCYIANHVHLLGHTTVFVYVDWSNHCMGCDDVCVRRFRRQFETRGNVVDFVTVMKYKFISITM